MKTTFKILLFCLSILWLNSSCSSDDSSDDSSGLFVVNDYTVTMDENPTENQLIGSIPYQVGPGQYIAVSILTQTVQNAIYVEFPGEIDSRIFVNDPLLFDFETHPVLEATVKVNKVRLELDLVTQVILDSKTITVTINLNDLPD